MPRQQSHSHSKPALMVKPRSPTIVHTQTAGFGQLIKEGIGFGAGSAIAQRAVTAILGPPTVSTVVSSPEKKATCLSERDLFEACMRSQNECNNEYLSYSHCIKLSQKDQ